MATGLQGTKASAWQPPPWTVGSGIRVWAPTLGSLPAPTYLIGPIIPPRPHPAAPWGQLALALSGVALSQDHAVCL